MSGGQSRSRSGTFSVLLLAVCVGAAAVTFVIAWHAAAGRDEDRRAQTTIELFRRRDDLERAHLAEVDALLREVFGAGTTSEVDQARSVRVRVRADATTWLTTVASGSGDNAVMARRMLALLAADWVTEGEVSADTLYYAGRNLADQLLPLDGVFSEDLTELADLLRVDTVPMLISIDALRAQYVLDHPDVSDLLSTYLSNSEGYLTGGAGWLGPDESEPLKDAYVWSPNATTTHPSVAQMVDVLGSTSLWTYDRWIQSWVNPDLDPPPMALDEILSRAAAADTQIHAILDWTYASATSQRESASSSESSRYVVFLVLTALLGAVALSAATGAVVSHRRRSRRRERVAATDHLTGAGNRALLQERTAAYMADPAFTSHLLAMIDLDRFKLINDTWGHGAGDAVLVAVAAGLQGVIDRLGSLDPDLVGTVIRFGGDEFVLSLHAKGMIDRVEVLRQLETLRCTEIDVGDSDRTTLSFSVGLAATRGPTELSDAMDAADLATYEDKAARARLFEERRTARSASPSDIALPPPPPPPMPPPPPTPPSTSTSPTQ